MRGALAAVAVLAFALPASGADDKAKKPKLELRALPRMAFSPVNVFFTAEFVGGDDVEEYYCPELEWEWDDGGKSIHEADCDPYAPGTKIERRHSAEHEYRRAGVYTVKVTFRKGSKDLASNSVKVTVRPGLGDSTREVNE